MTPSVPANRIPGLLLLGALAVIGLAAFSARRTALASPGGPHRTSYFVQG